MMRHFLRLVWWSIAMLVTCSSRPLRAQSTVASTPLAAPLSPQPAGGDSVPSFTGFSLSSPIRLSLEGSVAPKAGGFPNCGDQNEVGNSVGGIPVQRYWERRLTPRLVLSGFTQLGCPIDAGIGAALTYVIPLRESWGLVFSGGAYAAPGQFQLFGGLPSSLSLGLGGAASPFPVSARVDLVWQAKGQRSYYVDDADVASHPYSVGVESLGTGRQQMHFGGGF